MLPKLDTPTFFLNVPSTKKKTKYRPFCMKEEKILMLIKEAKDTDSMVQGMKDIINACTFGKLDSDSLAVFDIEYIFLQLRSKSVGEMVELEMRCQEVHNDEDGNKKQCPGVIPIQIDISKIKVKFPKDHNNTFILDKKNGIGIKFKYPTIDTMKMIEDNDKTDDFEFIIELVDSIFDADNVYSANDIPREEIEEFIDSISSKDFIEIKKNFFDKMPMLSHTIKYTCPKCGKEDEYTFEGIADFF
jgi:endogenous inhibitor of DNA gyrase (YacG/DUF329 family)